MPDGKNNPHSIRQNIHEIERHENEEAIFEKSLNFKDDLYDSSDDSLIIETQATKMIPFLYNKKSEDCVCGSIENSPCEKSIKSEKNAFDNSNVGYGSSERNVPYHDDPSSCINISLENVGLGGLDFGITEEKNEKCIVDYIEKSNLRDKAIDNDVLVIGDSKEIVSEDYKFLSPQVQSSEMREEKYNEKNSETGKEKSNNLIQNQKEKETNDRKKEFVSNNSVLINFDSDLSFLKHKKNISVNENQINMVKIEASSKNDVRNKSDECITEVQRFVISKDNDNKLLINEIPKNIIPSTAEFSHILFFVDDEIKIEDFNKAAYVGLDIEVKKSRFNVSLGLKRFYVQKIFFKDDLTIFDVIKLVFEDSIRLEQFMNNFKVLLFNGIVVHPLKKFSTLKSTKEYILVTNHGFKTLGIDDSFLKCIFLKGLRNLGNTCFMNSALQCILNCKEFIDYFATHTYNDEYFVNKNASISLAFCDFVNDLYDKKTTTSAPVKVKLELGKKISIYKEKKEQDAAEFINDFLDLIHDELNEQNPVPHDSEEGYVKWKARNNSIVIDLFFSKVRSSIVCTKCEGARHVYEPMAILSLPIPKEKSYYNDIILFYKSPQKIPLKIFAEDHLKISDLKSFIAREYCTTNDLICVYLDDDDDLVEFDNQTEIKNMDKTIFCYEYDDRFINKYYWIDLKINKLIFGSDFGMKFLIKMKKYNEDVLYDILINKLIPFMDQDMLSTLYSKIKTLFKVVSVKKNPLAFEILDTNRIKIEISYWSYKNLFGASFDPKSRVISLVNKHVTIYDCLNLFQEKEYVYGNVKKLCNLCNKYSVCYKKIDIEEPAKYLIVQLKRFKYHNTKIKKIETYVDIPMDEIWIGRYRYKVIGISNHISFSGSYPISILQSDGHYTSYIRKNSWHHCNDDNVSSVDDVKLDDAYILFLERI